MPSTSAKQRRFMAAVAHNAEFAKEAGVPQSVGMEFFRADQAKAQQENRRDKIVKAMMSVRRS